MLDAFLRLLAVCPGRVEQEIRHAESAGVVPNENPQATHGMRVHSRRMKHNVHLLGVHRVVEEIGGVSRDEGSRGKW